MKLGEIVAELEKASGANRALDAAIGKLIGYRRKVEYEKNSRTGEPTRKVFWVVPTGDDYGRMPAFTGRLDAAFELTKILAQDAQAGVSWVDGTATARIGGRGYISGATPALALCIAALRVRLEEENGSVG